MYRALLALTFTTALSAPTNHASFSNINDFSIRLLQNVAEVYENNFAVSPLSVWNIFALLAEGAAGNTFTQLMVELRLPEDLKSTQSLHRNLDQLLRSPKRDVLLSKHAAMFAECGLEIHEEFCKSAYTYNTDAYVVDATNKTKLSDDINYFICLATNGNIRDIVNPEMLEDLRLLLIDALYFKANWTYPFDPIETKRESFYDGHGRTIGEVNMMYNKAPHTVSYSDDLGAEILEMTYGKNEEFSMMIIQSLQGNSLKNTIKNLSKKQFDEWSRNLQDSDNLPSIDCYVPRFKISSQLDLIQPLKYMGIYDIFDSKNAQLPGVSDSPLFVSATVQKVELEVTEEGTEAAIATVVGLEDRILGQRIEVNRPFVYFIVEKKSNVILLGGIYTVPSVF